MSPQKQNIVLFPFMAQGHIIPFLSLALKLEQKNHSITFINTPLNIKKLSQNLPKFSTIRLIEIPFDSTKHSLPPNSETTETLHLPLMLRLIESSPTLEPAFRNLISHLTEEQGGAPPLCIISDMFFAWSAKVAHEFGSLHAIFNAGGGYGMAGFHTTWLNLPHLEHSNSDEFWLPGFPRGYNFKTKNLPFHMQEVKSPWQFAVEMFEDWKETDAMLFNTVEEIDHTGLTYFREQFPNCSVYAIGPIISTAGSDARGGAETEEIKRHCFKFLNSKPENSVLYIAFGSQFSPSEQQTIELAKALEASNVNFLWVFRTPSNVITETSSENKHGFFPIGFEERIKSSNKGLLLKKWAPQMEILSHKSIGAFLSHCGWNSTIEALSNGVPMMSWPMGAEQPFNAQFLEDEMRLCVGLANWASVDVKCEEIVKKIRAMMEDGGDVTRRKACKLKEMIKNAINEEEQTKGSSVRALDSFLTTLLQIRKKLG
ncbi:UDP-glucuronosyl and UDP-glucosyl transferase [Handroanthus impetiginosus]|uniref:Glycosyltransferase n=1 Tax=Handroanthus impetiginosus TaxID=429701 RepID=A0A2G9HN65_9LAMI|nr:UDP-glucuronosyl and UDP-glucosyl transferase [Handroanthus impetiginosus]